MSEAKIITQAPTDSSIDLHIMRLQGYLMRLQALDRRFTLYRMAAFFTGLAAVTVSWATLPALHTRLVILAALVVFLVVVSLHRRVDRRIKRLAIWIDLSKMQRARLTLDWDHLPEPAEVAADDRCALDIDLDLTGSQSLHRLISLAVSREGSHRLAQWLMTPLPDPQQISDRQRLVIELKGMRRFRERLLLNLRMVTPDLLEGKGLLNWLEVDIPMKRLYRVLIIGALLSALNIVLLILFLRAVLPAYWIFTILGSLAFYFFNAPQLSNFLQSVVDLDRELDKFSVLLKYLETYPVHHRPNLMHLLAPFRDVQYPPSRLARRVKLLTIGVGLRSNPILTLILNLLLPWDYLCAYLASVLRKEAGRFFPLWLEAWSQLEALTSLANYAALNPEDCFPEVLPSIEPAYQAVSLGHPLIPRKMRVCNDFRIQSIGEAAIITGSNMAGKSTFIKTVGVNQCLANAGGPVCAASLRTLPFRLHTCIRITDSITDGFSYFYAEVKCLRALLEKLQASQDAPLLYLIDEIFRGTNNRERLIGSQSYLRALIGAQGIGLIATHDLELARLADADARVCNYHFRDEIQDRKLTFDYKVRTGPSPTTNALKIMELEGLPVDGALPNCPADGAA